MNALGNSKRRYMTSAERQAVQKEAAIYCEKYIDNAIKATSLLDSIAVFQTLEEDCSASKETIILFSQKLSNRQKELFDFFHSNTYTAGLSDHELYDRDYNLAKIKELCEYYELPFDEDIFVF